MTVTASGTLQGGCIHLKERAAGLRDGRVRVVVIEEQPGPDVRHLLTFGMFGGGPDIPPEAFAEAQYSGEKDWAD